MIGSEVEPRCLYKAASLGSIPTHRFAESPAEALPMDAGHHHCLTKQSWLRQSTGTSDTGMVRSTAKKSLVRVPLF